MTKVKWNVNVMLELQMVTVLKDTTADQCEQIESAC